MVKKRRKQIIDFMSEQSVLIIHSGNAPKKSADQFYLYEVNRSFYYLTNINQSNSYLVLIKGKKQTAELLFLEENDPKKALWVGEVLDFKEGTAISKIDLVYPNYLFDEKLSNLLSASREARFGEIKALYFDFERANMITPFSFTEELASRLEGLYPYLEIKNVHHKLSLLRSIKDQSEITEIKKAIAITNEGIKALMKNAKPGLKEHQIEAYYNFVLNTHGVKPSFTTIAASGVNGTILHYEDNNQEAADGELILFDLGVEHNFYCSDITRTFPVNGKFSPRQKQIYQIVLDCNKKVIEFLKPGVTNLEFNNYAKKLLADGLIKIGKIKDESELINYYYHSIGHNLGLDVHDVGDYSVPFEKGQILTVEPGLYLKDEKIGIRIEDNILITEDGAINLSKDIIKEISDIEAFMKK